MNFYKHHIGDYAQATAHLTFAEDAAYSRLLRKYYAEEKPIPVDLRAAQRLVGARTRDEREAVETVLSEFFVLEDDGWHNKRADEELGRWHLQAEANRKTALEREERRRMAHDRRTNRAGSEHESSNELCSTAEHESLPSREPNQKPEARSQEKAITPDRLSPTAPSAAVSGQFEGHERPAQGANPAAPHAIALNQLGHRCTAMNPDLVAFVADGGSVDHLREVAGLPECSGKPAAYVIRIARRELAERAQPVAISPSTHSSGQPSKTLQGIGRLENLIRGNQTDLATDRNRPGAAEALPALPRPLAGNGRD